MLNFHLGYSVSVVTELVLRCSTTFNLKSAKGLGSLELSNSAPIIICGHLEYQPLGYFKGSGYCGQS